MKNLFSNPKFLHIFYGSVVALLSLYYFVTRPSEDFTSIIKTLVRSTEITQRAVENDKGYLDRQVNAYRNAHGVRIQSITDSVMIHSNSIISEIHAINQEFYREIEGENSFLLRTSIPTRLFFSDKKILMMSQLVDKYKDYIAQKIEDPQDRIKLLSVWNNETSFNVIQSNFKSLLPNQARLYLLQQIANIKQLELSIVNCYSIKAGGCAEIKFDKFMVGIFPNYGSIRVGDTFMADITATSFTAQTKDMTFYVNGKAINANDGVTTFKQKYNTVGKQHIKATVSLKNPFTGEIENSNREFTFEVLPK